MGKIRQLVNKVWDRIGGDALWHIITETKRKYLGRVGVSHVLTFIGSLLGGIYGAIQASIHSQPTYIIVTFFVLLFAGVLGIINFLWALWNKWQQHRLVLQPATSPTLGPDELIHPPSSGVLWRWNPEVAADGPFCPTHPQERLFLKGKYGGQKWKDFEADYIDHHRFTCPINQSEDFKFLESPEQVPLRIYQLRAQATARFRAMYKQQDLATLGKREEETEGRLEIEQTHSEIMWGSTLNGELHRFSNEERVPHNASFVLQVGAKITATPPRWVEDIRLELTGNRIDTNNWIPERITGEREIYVRFGLPSSIGQGEHAAQLTIKALGANRGTIEKRSQRFDAVIAYSYSDLQKFPSTSRQETTDPTISLNLDPVRHAQHETLVRLFKEGTRTRDIYTSLDPVSPNIAQEWEEKVCSYLKQALGSAYVFQFQQANSPFSFSMNLPLLNMSKENYTFYVHLNTRLKRLSEIIEGLED